MGWFYGFKLYLIHKDEGSIIEFLISPDNIRYNNVFQSISLLEKIYGKLFGDKGYIVKKNVFDFLL